MERTKEQKEVERILDSLTNKEQRELFLTHKRARNIEQWLWEYYGEETKETLMADIQFALGYKDEEHFNNEKGIK